MDERSELPNIDLIFRGTPLLFFEMAREYATIHSVAYGIPKLLGGLQKQGEHHKVIDVYDRDMRDKKNRGAPRSVCRLSVRVMPKSENQDLARVQASMEQGDWVHVAPYVNAILAELDAGGWFEKSPKKEILPQEDNILSPQLSESKAEASTDVDPFQSPTPPQERLFIESEDELRQAIYRITAAQSSPEWWEQVANLYHRHRRANPKYTYKNLTTLLGFKDHKNVGEQIRKYPPQTTPNHPKID
jgi:hypothetical protein